MESTFIWVVVFAGVIVGIFGTLLLASEKDLRVKKRRVEELEDMLTGAGAAPTTDRNSSDPEQTDERASQRESLLAEISELTSRLENNRVQIEELEANQARLGALESEVEELRESNQRLEDEGSKLKNELQASQTRIAEAADRHREGAEAQSLFDAEIAALKEQLEESRAKVSELESAQERATDLESREKEFKESQRRLEEEVEELKTRLATNQASLQEIETSQSRLSEIEQRHREVNDDNTRLRERLSELKDRLAKGAEYGSRLQATRDRLHEFQARQADLTERSRRLEDELSEVKSLLDSTSEAMFQHDLFEMPPVDESEGDGNPGTANERAESESGPREEVMIEAGGEHSQPVRPEEELVRLDAVLAREPDNREARLCHLLASARLYNVYDYEKEIDAIKDMKGLTERERIAARDLFLLRANEAQKRGRDDEMLRYRSWAKNVVFRTPFGAAEKPSGADSPGRTGAGAPNEPRPSIAGFPAAKPPEAKHVHVIFMAMIIVFLLAGVLAAGFLRQNSDDGGFDPQAQIESTTPPELPAADPERSAPANDMEPARAGSAQTIDLPKKSSDTRRPPASAVSSAASPKNSRTAGPTARQISGKYRVVRATKLHSAASENSRTLAILDPGIQVNVVDARSGWLEIRSRHGRPPGFIKKDAAVPVENLDVSLLPNRGNSPATKTP